MPNDERLFWMAMRRALLIMVDAIECKLGIERTSDIRRKVLKPQVICDTMSLAD